MTPTNQVATTQLNLDMSARHLTPLWQLEGDIMAWTPRPQMLAWLWKWDDLYDIAQRAGALVPVERGGDRRAIALSNPGLGGLPYATPTLWAAIQWLNGREVAPAHRHTSQAVRFIIDGAGSYSTVEGDKVFLERGDLVLTPPWLWHDHGSAADERAVWMDGLDIPLNNYLDASFFEPHPSDSQTVTAQLNGTVLKHGVGQMRPAWEAPSTGYPPLSTYKWADTERALLNLAQVAASPFDDVALEYTNPHTGGPVMQSFTCWIQMLRPGVHTQAHRHTGSAVYLAFEGRGETIIDGIRFPWSAGDMFTIPSWAVHEHCNGSRDERAILFSLQDTPLLRAVNKYREEAYTENGGHQAIRGVFEGC
ncbi:MAG: cupin domain-containing protein [Caldilineaceae bacterium]